MASGELIHGTAGAEVAHPVWGKMTWDIFPFYDPIVLSTFVGTVILGIVMFAALTYYKLWGYLWREWFTSIDHKKIGIMYMILGLVMLVRGFADALLMRGHQALASMGYFGYLDAHHYDQIFTAHGVIMIFFVAMPFV
ncbi:MAG: cbb3-type cytochrome c oxidase subunit I, partial [Pseudomonadota bacterium]